MTEDPIAQAATSCNVQNQGGDELKRIFTRGLTPVDKLGTILA